MDFDRKETTHQALKQCQQNAKDGYKYVIDMDLEKFFDTVCQSKLIDIVLNELDKELTKRGHRFVSFADGLDDCLIFCKSKKSAQRTEQTEIKQQLPTSEISSISDMDSTRLKENTDSECTPSPRLK